MEGKRSLKVSDENQQWFSDAIISNRRFTSDILEITSIIDFSWICEVNRLPTLRTRRALLVFIPQAFPAVCDTINPLKSRCFAFFNTEFDRIWARSFSFSRIAIFWGELGFSSYHHWIRRRILRRYSWSLFFLEVKLLFGWAKILGYPPLRMVSQ